MRNPKFNPRRYQLKKEASKVVQSGHPWIFRSHLSSAAQIYKTGDWLRLINAENETIGFGIFDADGLIGIRVLKEGDKPPDSAWIQKTIERALVKRENVRKYSNAFRALNGENDRLPGVVFDVYGDTGVLQTYSASVDVVGRYAALYLKKRLSLKNILWKIPKKRKGKVKTREFQVLCGINPGKIHFREGTVDYTVDVGEGQKSGTFLDLRGLRKWVRSEKLKDAKVLNLFSYTGTLGLAAELAGAKEIWNVDIAKGALEFASKHHVNNSKKHRFIEGDIFHWIDSLNPNEKFDLIIVDPPNMASKSEQIPKVLKAYQNLYRKSKEHLKPGGLLAACCCTSRISRNIFAKEVDKSLQGLSFQKEIAPEEDHPVGFREGDYLKLRIYKKKK